MSKKNRWVDDESRRAVETRHRWMGAVERARTHVHRPATADIWDPEGEACSPDERRARHDRLLGLLGPFLYENSAFYRRRFDALGLAPGDITSVDSLARWPVVRREEMVDDARDAAPFGTYHSMTKAVWERRGWMQFSTAGVAAPRRVFRYTQWDRLGWAWANARALHAAGITKSDTLFVSANFGPNAWVWGLEQACQHLAVPIIPAGGLDARTRLQYLARHRPSVLVGTPSHLQRLASAFGDAGVEPSLAGVRLVLTSGEPAHGDRALRAQLEAAWNAPLVDLYTCTEVSPQAGAYTCRAGAMHLVDDLQIWEVLDPVSLEPVGPGQRGVLACTNLLSESSPQLRFLVGDVAEADEGGCACGRSHRRLPGGIEGRAEQLVTVGQVSFLPSQLEETVRSGVAGGEEFDVVLSLQPSGRPLLTIVLEDLAGGGPVIDLSAHVRRALGARPDPSREEPLDGVLDVVLDVSVQGVAAGQLPRRDPRASRFVDRRPRT